MTMQSALKPCHSEHELTFKVSVIGSFSCHTCQWVSVVVAHICPSRSPGVTWLRSRGRIRWWSRDSVSPLVPHNSSNRCSAWKSHSCPQSRFLGRVIEEANQDDQIKTPRNCFSCRKHLVPQLISRKVKYCKAEVKEGLQDPARACLWVITAVHCFF